MRTEKIYSEIIRSRKVRIKETYNKTIYSKKF